jgi:pimeloyl-ACP methyl ester carboxylesterase
MSSASNPVIGWPAVVPALVQHFTVYSPDRRGYGESGDGPDYAIEREFEDVAALADSIPAPVNLLGHSFGALCAAGAALLTGNLRRLIFYEPALTLPGRPFYREGVVARLQALLYVGDREGLLNMLFREIAEMPPHEFEQLRSAPSWPARIGRAHLVVRESWGEDRFVFDPQRFAGLQVPTLLLSGGDSPQSLKAITEAIHAALPNSRIAAMPGQQHFAMVTAPDLFLREVLAFLRAAA